MLRLTVMRMTKTKWEWVGTRMWAAAVRTMRTIRRKALEMKRGAMRSELEISSLSTVILFCSCIDSPATLPPLFAVLLAQSRCGLKKPSNDDLSYLYALLSYQ